MLGVGLSQSLVDQPTALVVQDIGTDLANELGITIAVKVIVLNLEVLAERNEDFLSSLERGFILDANLSARYQQVCSPEIPINLLTMCIAKATGR